MKRLFLTVLLLCVSVQTVYAAEAAISLELKTSYSRYLGDDPGKDSNTGSVKATPRLDIRSESGNWELEAAASYRRSIGQDIHEGVDILERKTVEKPEGSLDRLAVIISSEKVTAKIGKQSLSGHVKLDSIDLNPLGARDLSEPFRSFNEGRKLGVWGISLEYRIGEVANLETVVAYQNNPIIAADGNDHWSRELPPGLNYGEAEIGSDLNGGVRIYSDNEISWELTAFYGSANAVDHMAVEGENVSPVFPKQMSAGVSLEVPTKVANVRLGGMYHRQDEADDFLPWVVELEKIWENVFRLGDNVFFEVGYSDVVGIEETEISVPETDTRRIYEGGSVIVSLEYSPTESWVLKTKGAYNIEAEGFYISPEIVWNWKVFQLAVKGEIIDGKTSDSGVPNTVWGEHQDDDRILVELTVTF